jgi:hypothetical protein
MDRINRFKSDSALADMKINLFFPLISKGNMLIFSFHPFGFGAKKLKIFETGCSVKVEQI